MSILSSLFSTRAKNEMTDMEWQETQEPEAKGLAAGTLLKVFTGGKLLSIGSIRSIGSENLAIVRQPGQQELKVCKIGEEVCATNLNDVLPYIYVMRGTVAESTGEELQIVNMKTTRYENQRSSSRLMLDTPVLIYNQEDTQLKSVKGIGHVVNIGTGGVCVQTKSVHQEGDSLQLKINFKRHGFMVLPGQVVRVDYQDTNVYQYGVCFQCLTSQDKEDLERALSGVREDSGIPVPIQQAARKPAQEPAQPRGRQLIVREVMSELMENVRQDRELYPESGLDMEKFLKQLEQAIRDRYPKTRLGDSSYMDTDAQSCLYISSDHMIAYICILPPVVGNKEINRLHILADLRGRKILGEIPQDAIKDVAYLHIAPLVRGTPAVDGVDGVLTELFPRRPRFYLRPHWEQDPDFSESAMPQAVKQGTVICRLQPPVEGREGLDVTGKRLPFRRASCPALPLGENTSVSSGGAAMVANLDGLLYFENGKYGIQPQRVVVNGLNANDKKRTPNGVLQVTGGLFIDGDVSGGVRVEAEGDIVISGQVRDARITSKNGSIRVQGGICGWEGQTFVNAAQQLQAKQIQYTRANIGGDVVTGSIIDSELDCGDTVRVLGGEGLIAGSIIRGKRQVACRRIDGSQRKCEFSLGCDPNTAAELQRIQRETASAQKILDKLWKNTSQLKMSAAKLTTEQKDLLQRLLEQRELYEQKIKELKQSRKELREKMNIDAAVHIFCDELEPVVEVQIGDKTDRFTQRERRCNIHIEDGWIVARKSS